MLKNILSFVGLVILVGLVGGTVGACSRSADVASYNISERADNFEIPRRIVLYNGFTDTYVQEVKGFCSLGNDDAQGEVSVTCKTPTGEYLKHIWKLGDNTTVFSEQVQAAAVSDDFYTVVFKPSVIIPAITLR